MKVEETFLICRVLFLKSLINSLFHWLGFCGGCFEDGFSLLESREVRRTWMENYLFTRCRGKLWW
jgi:hypothetical protein